MRACACRGRLLSSLIDRSGSGSHRPRRLKLRAAAHRCDISAASATEQWQAFLRLCHWQPPPPPPLSPPHRRGLGTASNAGSSLVDDPWAERRARPIQRQVQLADVTVHYARSGGPGGQNVNKVNTKVDMRLDVLGAGDWLPDWVKDELLTQQRSRINTDGELVVTSQRTRSQTSNREDALGKLRQFVAQAAFVPPPPSAEKARKVARLARRDNQRRLNDKKRKQQKKSSRGGKGDWS